eukprot:868426_1
MDNEEPLNERKSEMPNSETNINGVADLSMMSHFEMEDVLNNIEYRYCKMKTKHCYTSMSTILLSVNPYQELPIYGDDVIKQFQELQNNNHSLTSQLCKPHPFAVAARSYKKMITRKCHQSIITHGLSGSGKTETAKHIIKYLVMGAPMDLSWGSEPQIRHVELQQQIIASHTILQAFGNAKTTVNNTASRFGTFTKVLYDVPEKATKGALVGAYIETYFLETSRVVSQPQNERNYHIPYFMYFGIPQCDHKRFGIQHPSKWHYTNQTGVIHVPCLSDKDGFNQLTKALQIMRFDADTQDEIWKIVSGIMTLGNITYSPDDRGFAQIHPASEVVLDTVSELWRIDKTLLRDTLTKKSMFKYKVFKLLSLDDAVNHRDSIAMLMYNSLFLWLNSRINAEMASYRLEFFNEDWPRNTLWIGIVDVFGFANAHVNSLEQFCINFANEKLHQFFNFHTIQSEQEEYIKEGINWTPLRASCNYEYISMIEDRQKGFFAVLDSACKAPQPSVEAFLDRLFQVQNTNTTITHSRKQHSGSITRWYNQRNILVTSWYIRQFESKSKHIPMDIKHLIADIVCGMAVVFSKSPFNIEIKHYADVVTYDVSQFLPKNMLFVHRDIAKMVKKSESALVKNIANSMSKKRRKKHSVTGLFNRQIRTLLKNLHCAEPFFIHCIQPNEMQSPDIWDRELVQHQLRGNGLDIALKVFKLGYPTRMPHHLLYDRFHDKIDHPLLRNMKPDTFCTTLLRVFDVYETDYEWALTKILFKPSKATALDRIMTQLQSSEPLNKSQKDRITNYIVQQRIAQVIGVCRSFLKWKRYVQLNKRTSSGQNQIGN